MRHSRELQGIAGTQQLRLQVHQTRNRGQLRPASLYHYKNHQQRLHENLNHVVP
ncbi:hypothetical protein D3C80_384270 [compost metagenome]